MYNKFQFSHILPMHSGMLYLYMYIYIYMLKSKENTLSNHREKTNKSNLVQLIFLVIEQIEFI